TLSLGTDLESVRADLLVALVRGYDEVNRPEQALKYMRQLLDHYRGAREKGLRALPGLSDKESVIASLQNASSGLHYFEFKEAQLRAQVAEREVVNSRIEMLERLAVTADLKEEASGEHGYRVGKVASLTAASIGWAQENCRAIDLAARLHDIGKVGMPD